ncbi:hypothetical protein ACLJJ6_02035 [Pediococcus siamensis]|uniref:hypothetical protein n=1 Tax=Pediococcus siamensis TaxID=381829 RepID=UPI0039A3B3D7
MYKHLIATVVIKDQQYAYHFVSQDLQAVQAKKRLLETQLADKMLKTLYRSTIVTSADRELQTAAPGQIDPASLKLVKDVEAFVKLVNDKKLITIAKRLEDREMNNPDQLTEWFSGD